MIDSGNDCSEQSEIKPVDPAVADYNEGRRQFEQGNLAQAANSFHNAIIGYEQSQNMPGLANAADKLGDVCMARAEYAAAVVRFEKAYAICHDLNDPFSLLTLRKKLAKCHLGLGRFEEAIKTYLDNLDAYEGMNNPAGAVDTLVAIAEVYKKKGEPANAGDAYRTAASIHANFGHKQHTEELLALAGKVEAGLNG